MAGKKHFIYACEVKIFLVVCGISSMLIFAEFMHLEYDENSIVHIKKDQTLNAGLQASDLGVVKGAVVNKHIT